MTWSPFRLSSDGDDPRDQVIDKLTEGFADHGNATTNLYSISYRDPNPQRAEIVVQQLLKIFVESSLGGKQEDTRSTLQFLDEQIARYEQSLQVAESRLKDFRLKYLGMSVQSGTAGQDYFSRMSKLTDDITNTKLELRAATESRDSYRRDLASQTPTMASSKGLGASPAPPIPEIDQRIAAQKTKLDELLRSYTDQHPDVVGTRRVIGELEEQRRIERIARERAAAAAGKPVEPSESNPVFEKIRVALADAEAKVASLQGRLAAYESEYAQLRNSAGSCPRSKPSSPSSIATTTSRRRLTATCFPVARLRPWVLGFRKRKARRFGSSIRHAFRPNPSRRLVWRCSSGHCLLAMVAGLLASFTANEIAPTIHDARALREASARPVLGMLSLVPNESLIRRRRRSLIAFVTGLSGLFAAFAATIAIATLRSARGLTAKPMDLIEQAAKRLAELQRAGAADADAGTALRRAIAPQPTPERAMLALDRQRAEVSRVAPAAPEQVALSALRTEQGGAREVASSIRRFSRSGDLFHLTCPRHASRTSFVYSSDRSSVTSKVPGRVKSEMARS